MGKRRVDDETREKMHGYYNEMKERQSRRNREMMDRVEKLSKEMNLSIRK